MRLQGYIEAGRSFGPWERRPQLSPALLWVWGAYWELVTCRPIGMAVGPIPWTAIHEYAVAREVVDELRFERLIRAMDSAALTRAREREEARHG